MMTAIWWIRRDLRLTDNVALHAALEAGTVIPTFVIDPAFVRSSTRRKDFLYEGLHALDKDLQARGSYLVVRAGQPRQVLQQLISETSAEAIFAEEDFTPYARARDQKIARILPLTLMQGQTVHHPSDILKSKGGPYVVYTPYAKAWKTKLPSRLNLLPAPERIHTPVGIGSDPLPKYKVSPLFPASEREALVRLEEFLHQRIFVYSEHHDRMDLDGTSALSPYLRFGMIGLRQAVSAAQEALVQAKNERHKRGVEAWLNELIWREFYIQILYHFPYVRKATFNPAFTNIQWRNNEDEFEAWKEGRTGVPIIDAAMCQLKEIGWMHNRARMIVASYLVKDLLIDWRWGEAWFMENLIDGDIASNNGGWQWTAGTGTDAAPYFRVFNPVLQSKKFDPDGNYIRRWLPELRHLESDEIHAPWEQGIQIPGYPQRPIIERDKGKTLQAYQESRRKWSEGAKSKSFYPVS